MAEAIDRVTLNRANSAVLARDFALAERLYHGLLRQNPTHLELLGDLGSLYVKSGRDSEALAVYKKILDIDPQNLNAMNNLGSIYRHMGQFRDSVAILEQGIIIDEQNIQLFYNLGFTYKDMGKYDDAIKCFNMVIEKNPNDVLAYNHLGSIYIQKQEFEKAKPVLERGLRIDPNHPVLHFNLAKVYENLNEREKVSHEYESALRSRPGWIEAIDSYADFLLASEETAQAKTIVGQALELDAKNASMHTKMGKVYAQQESYDNAENEFNEALSLAPENTDALSNLADVYELDGKILDALHTMEKYEQLSPNDVEMLQQYTHILLTGNKLTMAREKIKHVLDKNPDDAKSLNLLGQYYICNGEDDKADECFSKIQSVAPGYTAHYRDSALRYEQKGDYGKSESNLKKYLDKNPGNSRAMSMLASNYEKQNRLDDAAGVYEQLASSHHANPSYANRLSRVNGLRAAAKPKSIISTGAPNETEEALSLGFSSAVESSPADFDTELNREILVKEEEPGKNTFNSISFESLAANDDTVSPFERIDDEIETDNQRIENSLDDLIPRSDMMTEEPADDFFGENPFTSENSQPRKQVPEEKAPKFEEEQVDSFEDEPEAIFLDEDVAGEDDSLQNELLEPETLPSDDTGDLAEPEVQSENTDDLMEMEPEVLPDDDIEDLMELAPEADDDLMELSPDDVQSVEDAVKGDETDSIFADDGAENLMDSEDLADEIATVEDNSVGENLEDLPDAAELDAEEVEVPEDFANLPDVNEQIGGAPDFQQIVDSVTDTSALQKYKDAVSLFKTLRSLTDSLAQEKKEGFSKSWERVLLEYIISRLEGRPGLLAVSEASRKVSAEPFDDNCQTGQTETELVAQVLASMRSFIRGIADKDLADSIDKHITTLLSHLTA